MKVWVFAKGENLIEVYSSEPSHSFLKRVIKHRYEFLSDSDITYLQTHGWTTDGYSYWTLTEVEVVEPND
jgi:hypothetical protein